MSSVGRDVLIVVIVVTLQLTSCSMDMCQTLPRPAVNSTWRPDGVLIPFISQRPLTIDMMEKGFPDLTFERIARFYNFFSKLTCGKSINILVLGGSFTYGTSCCVDRAWPQRYVIWMRRAYPGININLISRALGSTSSLYGMHVINEYNDIDLIFVDYCLNDQGSLAHHKEKVMMAVTETIVRTMTLRGTAVIYVTENMVDPEVEKMYRKVTDYYDASTVSYAAAVADRVAKAEAIPTFDPEHHLWGNRVKYSIFWTRESYRPHPNWVTHQLMADMIAELFSRIGEKIQQLSQSDIARIKASSNLDLKPALYMHDDQIESRIAGSVMCHPALVVLSTLEQGTAPFTEPYWFYKDYKRKPHYFAGWNFTQDVPGKPMGWIADSSTRPAHVSEPHIMFPILLSSGRVSITYLSSYENCGQVEAWLTYIDPATKYGSVATGNNIISCCNESVHKSRVVYPHKYMPATNSAFLDTLDTSAKVSEMRTVTYNFGVAGCFALNLLHSSLPSEEIKRRKGDKVKILGIKSC